MNKSYQIIIFSIFITFLSGPVHAQLGGFLKELKDNVDSIKDASDSAKGLIDSVRGNDSSRSVPGSKKQEVSASSQATTPPATSTGISNSELSNYRNEGAKICTDEYKDNVFSCKINGEAINYCKVDGPPENTLQVIYQKKSGTITFNSESFYKKWLNVSENNDSPFIGYRSFYFEDKGITYVLSTCNGPHCPVFIGVEDLFWLAEFKGTKKISNNFCDKGTTTAYKNNQFDITNNSSDKTGKFVPFDHYVKYKKFKLDTEPPMPD